VKRFLDSSTPRREAFVINNRQIVSSHDLDQRAWAVQLVLLTRPRRPLFVALFSGNREPIDPSRTAAVGFVDGAGIGGAGSL